jgi:hypothetical protein
MEKYGKEVESELVEGEREGKDRKTERERGEAG